MPKHFAPRKARAPGMMALGRLPAGRMNQTEKAWEDELEDRRQAGEIVWYLFEALKLRLADNTFYTPDFMVMLPDGTLEIHEIKGFWTDDARVKIKVAAAAFPFQFRAIRRKPRKEGGGWSVENF